MGMSMIGTSCARRLWLDWRWASAPAWKADTLKKFEDGHRTEDLMAERLRMVGGITLHTLDPQTGEQFAVHDCGGHLRGHLDGAIQGLIQAPQTWHVWECKAVSDSGLADLGKCITKHGEKGALAAWNATYYAQAQAYMHFTGMTRHYLTVCSPGGRAALGVRTDYDAQQAEQIIARARRLIIADDMPAGISTDPAHWECKMCSHHGICHGTDAPRMTCRSCMHATPDPVGHAGTWSCALHKNTLTVEAQHHACAGHRYLPGTVARWAEVRDADPKTNCVVWLNKLTGNTFSQPGICSTEIEQAANKTMLGDPTTDTLRETFEVGIRSDDSFRDMKDDLPWLMA